MLRHPPIRDAKGALAGALISACLFAAAEMAVGADPSNSWAFTDEKGPRANSIALNGAWEFAVGDGNEAAETGEGAGRLGWKAVTLPDSFMKWSDEAATKTRFVWARRDFTVTADQARSLAVLRWNGLPGTVAAGTLEGPALVGAQKILWVREPKNCVAAEVPVAGGKGTIFFSQLAVQGRLDPSSQDYDPVAERFLINVLQGKRR